VNVKVGRGVGIGLNLARRDSVCNRREREGERDLACGSNAGRVRRENWNGDPSQKRDRKSRKIDTGQREQRVHIVLARKCA
jgi:hypothetical protein